MGVAGAGGPRSRFSRLSPVEVRESIEIGAPPEAVWSVVSDPGNDPRWCPKVQASVPAGDGRWVVTHKPVPLRPAMELAVELVHVEPPARLTMREEDETSVFEVEYLLEPTADGTRFTQVSSFEWKRLPRPLQRVFAHGVRRDVRGQLRELKRLVEG
jgi:uncharacterized protein YndB with AHSA1/START domain